MQQPQQPYSAGYGQPANGALVPPAEQKTVTNGSVPAGYLPRPYFGGYPSGPPTMPAAPPVNRPPEPAAYTGYTPMRPPVSAGYGVSGPVTAGPTEPMVLGRVGAQQFTLQSNPVQITPPMSSKAQPHPNQPVSVAPALTTSGSTPGTIPINAPPSYPPPPTQSVKPMIPPTSIERLTSQMQTLSSGPNPPTISVSQVSQSFTILSDS